METDIIEPKATAEDGKRRLETPGSFTIMLAYMAIFMVTWLLYFVYLTWHWAVG